MIQIKFKRVYDAYDEQDGFRIFVDRLWPRGIKKEALHFDLWAKEITPSNELRKWVHADKEKRWEEFTILYEQEIIQNKALPPFFEQIKKHHTITLLSANKDLVKNHALILKKILEQYSQKCP